MDISIFTDKNTKPSEKSLQVALGTTAQHWEEIRLYALKQYPKAKEEWSYPGTKYGWSYRIKDSKRVLVYLLPRDGYFKVAFNFGEKAYNEIFKNSEIPDFIKKELADAKVYAEGRGIRIDIKGSSILKTIMELINIKISN